MKQFILAILLLPFLFKVSGQTLNIKEIDSLFSQAQGGLLRYPDSAWALSEEIRLLSREFNYEWGLLQSRVIKGLALYQKNELDSAAKSLLEIVAEAEKLKAGSFEEGRARTYLGFIYRRLNSFDKAEYNFRKATEIFQSLSENTQYTANLNNIGIIHGMRGQYGEALETFLKVREIALGDLLPEDQRMGRLSRALTNISNVYSEMGDHDLALDFAKQGLEIKLEMGDVIGVGFSYNAIGNIFRKNGQLDSAIYYYNRCIEGAPTNSARYIPIVLRARQYMAETFADKGDLTQALDVLTSSMKMRVENENYALEDALNLMALYHQNVNQIDSSLYYSNQALKMANANGNRTTARDASERLSMAYLKLKRYDSAYYYKSLYHQYNDSVFNESTLNKYNNLRIELETSEKQREIEVLQKQKEIDEKNQTLLIVSIVAILILSAGLATFLIYRHRNKQLKLRGEIEKGEMALQQQTLHMINLNNHIAEIENGLKSMKKKEVIGGKEVQGLLNNIFVNRSFEREWEQLETHFSKIHPNFNSQLLKRHDNLTQKERRLLALIKLDLNTREISGILSIEQRSVVMSRYRLKQKLGLEENEDLDAYVQTF